MPANLHANCSASSHCPEGVCTPSLMSAELQRAHCSFAVFVVRAAVQQHNMECVSGVCRNSSVFFHDAAPFGLEWDANWAQWSHSTALFLGTHPQPLWTEPTYAHRAPLLISLTHSASSTQIAHDAHDTTRHNTQVGHAGAARVQEGAVHHRGPHARVRPACVQRRAGLPLARKAVAQRPLQGRTLLRRLFLFLFLLLHLVAERVLISVGCIYFFFFPAFLSIHP